jgi:hypothetical protein
VEQSTGFFPNCKFARTLLLLPFLLQGSNISENTRSVITVGHKTYSECKMAACPSCGTDVAEAQKYCHACGIQLLQPSDDSPPSRSEIKELIADELRKAPKDSKLVEYETTEAIITRLTNWAKLFAFFLGIPTAVLLALLAVLGIKSYDTFLTKVKETQNATVKQLEEKRDAAIKDAEASGGKLNAEAKAQLEKLEGIRKDTVELGAKRGTELRQELDRLLVDYKGLKERLVEASKISAEVSRLNQKIIRIEQLLSADQLERVRAIISIFEFGSSKPNYSLILTPPASGPEGITFGYVFARRASGQLRDLLLDYLSRPNAKYAASLEGYRQMISNSDSKLDSDSKFIEILKASAADEIMRQVQDDAFARRFFDPAFREASKLGIRTALGVAGILDSIVHGGWTLQRDATTAVLGGTPVSGVDEHKWIRGYLERRVSWMKEHQMSAIQKMAYRPEALLDLANQNNWDLSPPIVIRGKTIDR